MTIFFPSSNLKIAKSGIFSGKCKVLSTYIKLCMKLNLRAYCLTSLYYASTIVFYVSCMKQKILFFKKRSYFLRLLIAFAKIFVSNDGQITECEK